MIQMTERARAKLLDLKARQEAGVHMMCPRCGMDTMKEPIHTNALSRSADVYVCDACGTTEAMLAHMKQDTPLFLWAAFCPERPPADFEARPAAEVLPEVTGTQLEELTRIYERCRDDPENAPWYRLEAFVTIAPALRSCGRSRFRQTTAPRMERLSSDSGATRTDASRWPQTFWTNNSPVDLKASGSFAWCFCRRRIGPRRGHVAATGRA